MKNMPFTPLHIGIPGLISYKWPERVDIIAAGFGAVLIDLDFFFFLLWGTPLHGFLHSFVGATVLAIILIIVIRLLQRPLRKVKHWFRWEEEADKRSIALGAFLGTYSHVVLDMFIYWDVDPFYPAEDNPFCPDTASSMTVSIIYLLASVTTLLLLLLYMWKFYKTGEEDEKNEENMKETMNNNEKDQ